MSTDVVADVISGKHAQERIALLEYQINILEGALSRIADHRTASAYDPGGADTLEEVLKGIEQIALEAIRLGGHPPDPHFVRARKVLTHLLSCSQCGQKVADRACGPTHAVLQADPWQHNRVQEILAGG
jgi:hypothetical protein